MKTIEVQLFSFSELSDEAKEKAISKWYEVEDCPFLTENLTERVKELLNEKGIDFEDIKLMYSLSYCQGDGLCFTGTLRNKEGKCEITHNCRYYFASSVTMDWFHNDNEENTEPIEEIKNAYFDICKKVEKQGYEEIEYRMNFDEFSELCEDNGYEFYENGEMY